MKLVVVLALLLLVVTACSSEDSNLSKERVTKNQEVVLTSSEQGKLKLMTPTQSQLDSVGMNKFPGYIDSSIMVNSVGMYNQLYNRTHNYPESFYVAIYETDQDEIAIHTITFNSEYLDLVLDDFILYSIYLDGRCVFLHKEKVIVVVCADRDADVPVMTEIANKLSQRLGMDVVDPDNPPEHTPEKCGFPYRFNCINHSVGYNKVLLEIENIAGEDFIIRDVTVTSKALKGKGNCTTGTINKILPSGEKTVFELDKSSTQWSCYYQDLDREKNLYRITVNYKTIDSDGTDGGNSEYSALKGALLASPPS